MPFHDEEGSLLKTALFGTGGYQLFRAFDKGPKMVADYAHNYLQGFYGRGVTPWQKKMLTGQEARKVAGRLGSTLLDPVEGLAYKRTGIAPYLHKLHISSEREIERITQQFINQPRNQGISFDDAKFKIRNLEKQLHFKLTNDYSNSYMFRQNPNRVVADYASKYVEKTSPTKFISTMGDKNSLANKREIAKYVASRQPGIKNVGNVLFMKYKNAPWADVLRGAQFDPRFYKTMTTLKHFKGDLEDAKSTIARIFPKSNPRIRGGRLVFEFSPKWKSNFDWGGYNSVGIWDPKKASKIRIVATDKRDLFGMKAGGRNAINYVDSRQISINEATTEIRKIDDNTPREEPKKPKEKKPFKSRTAKEVRIEKSKGLRVGGFKQPGVLKNELNTTISKFGKEYTKFTRALKNPNILNPASRGAMARIAPFILRRAGLAGLGGYAAYKFIEYLRDR